MSFDNINNKSVAIIGHHDGSAGQVETWFEKATGLNIACFVIDTDDFVEPDVNKENKRRVCKTTDFPENNKFKGCPLIKSRDWIEKLIELKINKVLCIEPDNKKRKTHIKLIKKHGLKLVSAIHPTANILSDVKISDGVWINASVVIGYKAEVGAGVIINTGSQIDHHNFLEECCQVDPGVVIAGNVVLRECCQIHTGTTIINRVEIGENSIVGAGSVVLNDIPPNSTAVGAPAHVIKTHNT